MPDDTAPTYTYDGPEALRLPVLGALTQVVDPELALSIVDVGLIYKVRIADEHAHVLMTMTSPACPVTDVILEDVENALDKVIPAKWRIDVELCWEPPWTPERMSARAKRFMKW
ncbi:metal-sulfur cluster assembly factor [Sphaerotilaceae bacterium SBD11-9]